LDPLKEKECPICGKFIPLLVKRCPYCHENQKEGTEDIPPAIGVIAMIIMLIFISFILNA